LKIAPLSANVMLIVRWAGKSRRIKSVVIPYMRFVRHLDTWID
jgi:hypothetical protein